MPRVDTASSAVTTTDAVPARPLEGSAGDVVAPSGDATGGKQVETVTPTSMDPPAVSGPDENDPLPAALLRGTARVAAALADTTGSGTRDGWLQVVGQCQGLLNSVTALQDVALAEVARRESDWSEDGTLYETVHGHGRITIDAADIAAPALGASHGQAERRVEQAVRVAASRVPVDADSGAVPEPSGLGVLHTAMVEGRLDGYRASVIAAELEVAPADVAEAVVAALEPHLDDEGPLLRRRCRRLLARISPELLRQRALRARVETGLRRWVAEPGVDAWHGTFPSEDAAMAWAAIDRLAHDLVAAGTCSSVEQARGKALTDLVTGNATVDAQLVLTVPAGDCDPGSTMHDTPAQKAKTRTQTASQHATPADSHPTGAPKRDATPGEDQPTGTRRPDATRGEEPVGHRAATRPPESPAAPSPDTQRDALVQVQGARPSEPLLVRRSWLRDRLADTTVRTSEPETQAGRAVAPCDPLTGARVDPADRLATPAYRPGAELVALVRARDGRCRFPGCAVAARFCDLDHVRPWPTGPTAARNLLSLCRRHHRIKQRPGWRLNLAPDGTATWTDPMGAVRTTAPLDALDSLVLLADHPDGPLDDRDPPARAGGDDDGPRPQAPTDDRSPRARAPIAHRTPSVRALHEPAEQEPGAAALPWSALESHLEFRLEHRLARDPAFDHGHRWCTSSAALRAAFARRRARAPVSDAPPF
jgi:hypothetical protein